MDLKSLLIITLIPVISCQDVTVSISQPSRAVGSQIELVCAQSGQGWKSVWNRDGEPVLTLEKRRGNPCYMKWFIETLADATASCPQNSGRFILTFLQSTIELNGTTWNCEIDYELSGNNVTVELTERKKAQPTVKVQLEGNPLVVGGNVTVTCNVVGVANVTDITWGQYWKDNLVRRIEGSFSSLHQFNVSGITYADEGNYTCNVTAVDLFDGEVYLSGSVEILIKGPPVFKRPGYRVISAFHGQDVTLSFQYISGSVVANHSFLHNDVPEVISSRPSSVQVTFLVHNVHLRREGFMVNFTLNNITDLQNGNYSLRICNDLACSTSHSVQLLVSDPITPNEMTSTLNFLIPLGVGIGCVLLAAVVAGIIITERKCNHRKSCVSGVPKPDDSNDEKLKERALSLDVQNDLCETSSRIDDDDVANSSADDAAFRRSVLVMQENELYEKSEEDPTVQIMDTADIYSEVRKT